MITLIQALGLFLNHCLGVFIIFSFKVKCVHVLNATKCGTIQYLTYLFFWQTGQSQSCPVREVYSRQDLHTRTLQPLQHTLYYYIRRMCGNFKKMAGKTKLKFSILGRTWDETLIFPASPKWRRGRGGIFSSYTYIYRCSVKDLNLNHQFRTFYAHLKG